jgi:hypothetical protein
MAVRTEGSQELEQLTQRELIQLARRYRVRGAYRMRKPELITALRKAQAIDYADHLDLEAPAGGADEPRVAERRQEDRQRARRRSMLIAVVGLAALTVVVVVLVLVLAGGGSGSEVGASKSAGATQYKLLGVTTQSTIGTTAASSGTFVVADVQVTPPDGVRAFAPAAPAALEGGDGNSYQPSADGANALGSQSLGNQELKPGATVSGKIAFDVPNDAVKGAKVVLRDLNGSDTATFRTGL